ncbi:MAG: lytic transglycosylase domain-containing protein [Candidatus Paceibacterota bacterium]
MTRLLLILSLFLFIPITSVSADPNIIQKIIQVESRGNPKARGRAGEYGLMQIKCQTARGVGFRGKCSELLNPSINIKYGTAYFNQVLKKAKGNICHALTLYNRGIGARPKNSSYCRKVLNVKIG